MKHIALLFAFALPCSSAVAQEVVSLEKALSLAGNVHVIFHRKCNECHGSELKKPDGKFGYVLDLKRMGDNLDYIVRGKPAASELFRIVNEGEMPPDDHPETPPLTGDEKDAVRRWIQAGAPHALPAVLPQRSFATPSPPKTESGAALKRKRLTLDIRDMAAGEVFAEISKQTGLRISYTAPANEPRLSVTLKNGVLIDTLDYLILCGNLTLAWEGDTAIIRPH